jgi:hypothetical protein
MRGAIPSLPNTSSWSGAQLQKKHRDNFTFIMCENRNTNWIGRVNISKNITERGKTACLYAHRNQILLETNL